MRERITRTFEITTSVDVMGRIERFLALLHYNSISGHSATFAMPLDGDGADKVAVKPTPQFKHEVGCIGGVGYHVEIAYDDCYSGLFMDRNKDCKWKTGPAANLYKHGEVVQTYPSRDYDYHNSEQPEQKTK